LTLVRLESRRYYALNADLNNWRNQIKRGDLEFDAAWEDEFKGALRSLVSLASLLIEKFDAYSNKGLFLAKTRYVGALELHRQEAQKIVDSWKSPEWETTNEQGVKWDKEQTQFLRSLIGSSCE
jgi:hypothetical protein